VPGLGSAIAEVARARVGMGVVRAWIVVAFSVCTQFSLGPRSRAAVVVGLVVITASGSPERIMNRGSRNEIVFVMSGPTTPKASAAIEPKNLT